VREELKEQQLSIVKELLAKLKVQENFGGKQTTVLEEQLLMTMKKMLAELKGPSQDVLPPSDTVEGEEDGVEKEKLRAQVKDLQKQLEEKKDKIRIQETFGEKQTTMIEELMTMKELLAELKGPSQDVLPPSDTVKGEEDDVEKENLRAQMEDLQKQLKEKDEVIALRNKQDMKDSTIEKDLQLIKQQLMTLSSSNVQTIAKQAESDGTADKEMLQKQVEHLQKKLDKKEEDLTTASQVEQTLRDTLSAERGRMEELRNETAGMKLETQDLSHQLSQSKECMKALENILNNLVLEEKMADKVVCCV
jgi:hypothetical protein